MSLRLFLVLSLLLSTLASASPTLAAAEGAGVFCMDRAELDAWRDGLNPSVRRFMLGKTSTMGPLIGNYERTLDLAEQGNPDAQRQLGGWWAACLLQGGPVDTDRPEKVVAYLRAAAENNDKAARQYLALFNALGWGVPQSYPEAYRLIQASGHATDPGRAAETAKLKNAPPAELEAVVVYGETVRSLLAIRLPRLSTSMIRDDAIGQTIALQVSIRTCPLEVTVSGATEGLDQVAAENALRSIVTLVPVNGLPCKNDAGEPFGMGLPLKISRPR